MSQLPSRLANLSHLFAPVLFFTLASCTSDPLEKAAWQASRVGTAVGRDRGFADNGALEAGSGQAERYYFVAKYRASQDQIHAAAEVVRRIAVGNASDDAGARPAREGGRSGGLAASSAPVERKRLGHSRYLAVRAPSDKRATSPVSVMVWDTHAEEFVGNNVYDINVAPPSGATIRFSTYSAEYVASGEGARFGN